MSLTTWTIEQILSLAHDQTMVSAAETVADSAKWNQLGTFAEGFWGEFPNRDKPAHRTLIHMPERFFHCDCPSRKYPCRHILGLSILSIRSADAFHSTLQPEWTQITTGTQDIENHTTVADLDQFQVGLLKAQNGLNAYSKWLRDMIHAGIADLPKKPAGYWVTMANRLSDYGLYKLAAELRRLPALTKMPKLSRPTILMQGLQLKRPSNTRTNDTASMERDWPRWLLQRIGRHYLIALAFQRYERLSPAARADLRYAAGWFADPRDEWSAAAQDHWSVLGSRLELRADENMLHTWIWGEVTHRFALYSRPLTRSAATFQPFLLGTTVDAAVQFYPGSWPFRVKIKHAQNCAKGTGILSPTRSIQAADHRYRQALAVNPWLDIFPQLLADINVLREEGQWFLSDQEGYRWALPDNYNYGWHLASIMAQEHALLFGEWNGRFFNPLSFLENGCWKPLQILRGIK
ncbi:MAG: hypothetical protein R3293_13060 [Candidatus Promineifilaceae bacterium]|nr:hypothetical protein [Candidatus Promineifilaceae bacterium]